MRSAPQRPPLDKVIWRYLSIDKYLDLLISSSLKFTQIKIAADMLETELMRHRLIRSGAFDGKEEYLEGAKLHIDTIRKTHYMSCWTGKEKECRSLWHSYLGESRIGVAVKSTIKQVTQSAEWKSYGYDYRLVDYRDEFEDLEELQINTTLVNAKSEAYAAEEEIRFTINESATDWRDGKLSASNPPRRKEDHEFPPVIPIQIKLDDCINEIWVSPFCSDWQISMLHAVTTKLCPKLSDRLRRSDIREKL